MHGDIAVSSSGEVYVSVEDPQAGRAGVRADGTFVRNVPNAPPDFHGFVIRRHADGEFIYGARLRGQEVVKLGLDGKVALTIPASSIPDEFKVRNARSGQLAVLFTGVDVAPNGDIYVTDGYASDFIHRFDRTGKYLKSFGGKQEPYKFNTLHKLTIDTPLPAGTPDRRRPRQQPRGAHVARRRVSRGRGRRICCCPPRSSSTATTPSSAS